MKLYGFPASPRTWQVRALAAHLAMPLELVFIDLPKGDQRKPEFLAINPTGRTPTLVDGDFIVWETAAVMQYVATREGSALLPDDARSRADIARWQSWTIAHFEREACVPLLFERLIKPILNLGPPDETAVANGLDQFARCAEVLEQHLGRHRYMACDRLTIADFAVAASLFYADRAGFPLADYPKVREWFGRVAALPCWAQTAPQTPAAAA